jgi:cephalosporin hydroxylase
MARITVVNPSVTRWLQPDRPAYRGIYTQQFEDDLARYAELIAELEPPWIMEVGRHEGGTALFLADELAKVRPTALFISIDVTPPVRYPPTGVKVEYLTASSTYPTTITAVRAAAVAGRGMVLLDGDHRSEQVSRELAVYADLADYLVVEDTLMRHLGEDDGPHIALDGWLPEHPEFVSDIDPPLTQHPGGWLRRIDG